MTGDQRKSKKEKKNFLASFITPPFLFTKNEINESVPICTTGAHTDRMRYPFSFYVTCECTLRWLQCFKLRIVNRHVYNELLDLIFQNTTFLTLYTMMEIVVLWTKLGPGMAHLISGLFFRIYIAPLKILVYSVQCLAAKVRSLVMLPSTKVRFHVIQPLQCKFNVAQ